MRKLAFTSLLFLSCVMTMFNATSCSNSETYADKKKKEKNAIQSFISNNSITGPITVITENEFYAQDSTTDVSKNQFVLFEDDGIYMQIIKKGGGQTFPEMSKSFSDSTVNKVVLCRFLEYNIETGDTTLSNMGMPLYLDKMLVNYSQRSRSYSASFTEGWFYYKYSTTVVPTGWLKPLDFVRISRSTDDIAMVRMIIPHSSGSSTASQYVYPFYYELNYQLGR